MGAAFVLAAPHSGAGKTTCTLALLSALKRRGLQVQAFKVGPDYIDPSHHARITGRPSHNLDTWMLPADRNRAVFERAAAGADVCVVEGVMGLFDGVDGRRPSGSTADLARQLDLPILLVVDARAAARSAAAVVHGFATFEPDLRIVGVVWNRVGSVSHRAILDESLAAAGLPSSLGAIPRDEGVVLPERHLGLVTPEDAAYTETHIAALADLAETHLDLEGLLDKTFLPAPAVQPDSPPRSTSGALRIGVARDRAFCFYYEENLCILERAGARLVYFRPTEGDGLPPDLDGLYLGGGYPEIHAGRLASNSTFLTGIRALHEKRKPIYGECGGFMVLCQGLTDMEGTWHPMAGIYPARAAMNARAFRLGYREIATTAHPRLGELRARGHEFHYSHITSMPETVRRVYRVWNARGETLEPEGYAAGNTLAGYIHLHFGSNPSFPARFYGLPTKSTAEEGLPDPAYRAENTGN